MLARDINTSVVTLAAWLGATAVVIWSAGAYPMWRIAGVDGLAAQAAAAFTVLIVFGVSVIVVKWSLRRGPAKAALTFIVTGLARAVLCAALAWVAHVLLDLPVVVLFIWVCVFYPALLTVEALWLMRTLARRSQGGGQAQMIDGDESTVE